VTKNIKKELDYGDNDIEKENKIIKNITKVTTID
jgi:hypothetical protein